MISRENKEKIKQILKKIEFLKILIPISGLIIANLQMWEHVKTTNSMQIRFIVYDIILNLIIILLSLVIYNQGKKIEKKDEEIGYLNERAEDLMNLNDSIRCFKHDFYNIIQAIEGYITMNNMPALEKYFEKILDECEHDKNVELLATKAIKDPAIYGILLNKYKKAEDKNITMNIDVLTDLEKISDKSYLLSRVMGILLDNAIEAASDCQNKRINVQFTQHYNDTVKRILIENTYENKDVDTDIIFEKEFSSKKIRGNTGLGLWKVRNMIKKESKVLLQTKKDSEMFKQEIEIMV